MDELSRLAESIRKLALDRARALQPYLERNRSLRSVAEEYQPWNGRQRSTSLKVKNQSEDESASRGAGNVSEAKRYGKRVRELPLSFLHGRLPSPETGWAAGKALRKEVPRESHAGWKPGNRRSAPVEILIASNKGRIPELVPIRHGRMLSSSFAFLRGSAALMAADLADTPVTGLQVQACGDCHLMNFGGFATPERNIFFDINDFDETLPAPWEWDVKRLAASFACAGRHIGLKVTESAKAVRAAVRFYRTSMAEYSRMPAFKAAASIRITATESWRGST